MSAEESPQAPAPTAGPAEEAASPLPFPIVGVGASAGGLEAFTELLENLPPDPGLAILFVLHLEPHHESHLAEVLAKVTPLPIHTAAEGTHVEMNHVYLIPPNTNMAMTDGRLTLTPRSPLRGQHMPIDHLFRSLAQIHKSRAIGVILSGGGTDGTLGFQAIKAEDGITFAQTAATARQEGMPHSAAAGGLVDYVLPPRAIAGQLVRLASHPYARQVTGRGEAAPEATDAVEGIITLLRARMQVDFTHYKRATIDRRIQRRMALRGLEKPDDYLDVLRAEREELQSLYQDLLIRVTNFFRDPEAFESLKEHVFPALVNERSPNSPIRIWVAGCSTGEEVYSLAIALLEFLNGHRDPPALKILATDLSEPALERARAGVFIDNIEIDVSPERLRRFFVRVDGHYQISKAVRELCVFSRHNLASDPPFSHLDVVSCRNVLIYLDAALQRRLLPILHFALNPGCFLFLGSSENVGVLTDLFEVVDSRHRIYAKKVVARAVPLDVGRYATTPHDLTRHGQEPGTVLWNALDVQREADRVALSRYAPVGVVIDETMTVLQFRGRTAPYLEPAPGMASLDLMRMLREGLRGEVRAAVTQAKIENTGVTREPVQVANDSGVRQIKIEVVPFRVPPAGMRFFLVFFQELATRGLEGPAPDAFPEPPSPRAERQLTTLQHELAATREHLQSVIENHESTNEELKSANEEILSANEELQSTNEELQTAKEEAQSANEELATVNDELRHRNTELSRVNNDLVNLLTGVNIPIVMVSRDLRVRRITPMAEKAFNLIPSDVGRPISDIKPNLNVADLAKLVKQVIDTCTPHEANVETTQGIPCSLRIRPYITLDNKIDGASIVLLEIDSLKGNAGNKKEKEED